MKLKILWIEDQAFIDLAILTGLVYVRGNYDLIIAPDASEGIRQIMQREFDAVVVDIRIPPGDDPKWKELYTKFGMTKVTARLGLHLLHCLLAPEDKNTKVKLRNIPPWITPTRFGILTVESEREVQDDLRKLNIQVFRQKTAEMTETTLLELIEEILFNNRSEI